MLSESCHRVLIYAILNFTKLLRHTFTACNNIKNEMFLNIDVAINNNREHLSNKWKKNEEHLMFKY